jgi:predicted ABC-type ATPase
VIFIGTEHPDLNIARIVSRVSRDGLFTPLATLHDDYESGLRQLKRLVKAASELVLLDNTVEGRSARVVAQFVDGKIVKLARSVPDGHRKCLEENSQNGWHRGTGRRNANVEGA